MINLKRESVVSSRIESIGYDKRKEILQIMFKRGGLYEYRPVTPQEHLDLMSAVSPGKFFDEHIRDRDDIESEKIM